MFDGATRSRIAFGVTSHDAMGHLLGIIVPSNLSGILTASHPPSIPACTPSRKKRRPHAALFERQLKPPLIFEMISFGH